MAAPSPRRPGLDARSMSRAYAPLALIIAAMAVFVTVVPSNPATEDVGLAAGGGDDASVPSADLFDAPTGDDPSGAPASSFDGDGTGGSASTPGATGARGGSTSPGSSGTASDATGSSAENGTTGGGIGPPPADCVRKQVLGDPCPPTWSGDNGGSTYHGVSADTVNLVVYEPQRDEQTDAVLAQADFHTVPDLKASFEAWEAFANEAYQLWGRKVDITVQSGPGDPVPEEQTADAVLVTEELDAFGVIAEAGWVEFHDEVSRRKIPQIELFTVQDAKYHDDRAPYYWSLSPDLNLSMGHVAEYWCKRLAGRTAEHAGSALIQTQKRKLGIVHPTFDNSGEVLEQAVKGCGGTVTRSVQYALDYTTAVQQSINIIAQMQSEGVTTIACVCDPIFPVFLTQQATGQGWFPEWLHTGYAATDSGYTGRLYDPAQWTNSFGTSVLEPTQPLATHRGWKAYFHVVPDGDKGMLYRTSYLYGLLDFFLTGIESAGPNLTPATLRQGLFERRLPGVPDDPGRFDMSFGPQGPSPYTAIDSVTEIWYSATQPGPDGTPGWIYYVDGARRYKAGEWPKTKPNVFVDDGSKQTEFDPNHP